MTTRQHIIVGKSVLREFLHDERKNLTKSAVLIISSAVPKHVKGASSIAAVDTACRKLQFYTSMEMGLRTVESHVTSAFPTLENVSSALEMAKRSGASTVIGVGSGAAMDLTRAVLNESIVEDAIGILAPSTYGGILASTSSLPLLLDTREEALIVPEHGMGDDKDTKAAVVIENDSLSDINKKDAAFACLAIGVDAMYRRQTDNGTAVLDLATKAFHDDTHLPEALLSAGNALSFGLVGSSVRSSPLALATSLIPPSFPNAKVLTFMASLLPGIIQVMADDDLLDDNLVNSKDIPSLASLMVHSDGAQSVSALLAHVKANRALWKCFDVEDSVLEAILHHSLNR